MKVKALLKDGKLILPHSVVVKAEEVGVEVDIPDEFVEIVEHEVLERMDFFELAEFIWKDKPVDQRDYKELVGEALSARYRGEL